MYLRAGGGQALRNGPCAPVNNLGRAVQAVLRLEDFNGKDTLDENYAALWAALEAELSALSAQGADSAGCSYADGAITIWA